LKKNRKAQEIFILFGPLTINPNVFGN